MAFDWLKYANQGATRNQALTPQLVDAFSFLPQMGVTMEVFSGGQPSSGPNRVGSHRHDHGGSGDVFFHKGGRRLDWANPQDLPIFQDIVRQAKSRGVTGFGAGPGYMQPGSMHVGFGSPSVWGAGGKGANAPDWLVEAYGGTPAGRAPAAAAPTMANMQNKSFDPVGEVVAAAAPDAAARGLTALFSPPGVAPTMPGSEVGNPTVPMPQTLGALAALFAQQQSKRNEERAAEAEAEQMRRAALFGPDSLAGLFGAA